MVTFEHVNDVLATNIGDNSLQEYLQAALVFALLWLGCSLVHRIVVRRLTTFAQRTATEVDDLLVLMLSRIGQSTFFALALYLSTTPLVLTEFTHTLIRAFLIVVLTIRGVIVIQEALRYSLRRIYRKGREKDDPGVEAAVGSLVSVLRWIIWIGAILFILDNLGVNITTMVAGIGIIGVAVGMASQAILGDAFSAFAIFLDKPFEVGDFVIIDDYMGTIEHIGIKTTRVRSLFGEQLVFANSDLTKSRIKNYKRMVEARGVMNFSLPFSTTPEKLRQTSPLIIEAIKATKNVRVDHVHMRSYGPAGYNFEAAFYVTKEQIGKNFDIQEEVYLNVAEKLYRAGITPSHIAQDNYLKALPVTKEESHHNGNGNGHGDLKWKDRRIS